MWHSRVPLYFPLSSWSWYLASSVSPLARRLMTAKTSSRFRCCFFASFRSFLNWVVKLDVVFHTSSAARSASMLEYFGALGLSSIARPSAIAAAVVVLGWSSCSRKGIPFSLIVVRKNRFTAVVMFKPSSLKIASACVFTALSVLMFKFVKTICPPLQQIIRKSSVVINTTALF